MNPKDTDILDDLKSVPDETIVEIANLPTGKTGIEGVVFISTAMGQHGARVKYFQKAGRESFSVTVSENPELLANSINEKIMIKILPKVIKWVILNKEDLFLFWKEGIFWNDDQIDDFKNNLKKI